MTKGRLAATAACCFVALFSSQAFAAGDAQCWQSYEIEAARVRDLQTMLMLESLKCRATNADMTDRYNSFSDKKHADIVNYDNILKARFMRANGITDGQRAYEEFATRIANSYSGASRSDSSCQMADTLLNLAINANDKELPLLARTFSETPLGVGEECAAPTPVTAAVAAPVIAESAEPAAVAKAVDPPAPQSPAAALEAAAIALQSAAASLKAQSAAATDKPVITETNAAVGQTVPATTAAPAT